MQNLKLFVNLTLLVSEQILRIIMSGILNAIVGCGQKIKRKSKAKSLSENLLSNSFQKNEYEIHPRITGIIAASFYLASKGKGLLGFYEDGNKIGFYQNDLNVIFPAIQYEKFYKGVTNE